MSLNSVVLEYYFLNLCSLINSSKHSLQSLKPSFSKTISFSSLQELHLECLFPAPNSLSLDILGIHTNKMVYRTFKEIVWYFSSEDLLMKVSAYVVKLLLNLLEWELRCDHYRVQDYCIHQIILICSNKVNCLKGFKF